LITRKILHSTGIDPSPGESDEFSRATENIAERNSRPDGFMPIESEEEDSTVLVQKRTHDLIRQLEDLRKDRAPRSLTTGGRREKHAPGDRQRDPVR
jgi:hypothetical protein